MTSLFIDRAIIEWEKIEEDSYLREIKAITDFFLQAVGIVNDHLEGCEYR